MAKNSPLVPCDSPECFQCPWKSSENICHNSNTKNHSALPTACGLQFKVYSLLFTVNCFLLADCCYFDNIICLTDYLTFALQEITDKSESSFLFTQNWSRLSQSSVANNIPKTYVSPYRTLSYVRLTGTYCFSSETSDIPTVTMAFCIPAPYILLVSSLS